MKKIGIALGGGGARGLAHIGILRAFEKNKLPVSYISGTSMGSIIGAAYAVDPRINIIEKRIRDILMTNLFSKMKSRFTKTGEKRDKNSFLNKAQQFLVTSYIHLVEETKNSLLELEKLKETINLLLPDINIEDTKIPYCCVATDLTNGKEKIFTSGPLRTAVLASSSIPGIFPPVNISGTLYNDGGAVNTTPINGIKKMGAEFVIACDVKSKLTECHKFEKAKDVVARYNYIAGLLLHEKQIKDADFILSPPIKHYNWTDFDDIEIIIGKSEQAATMAAAKIRGILAIQKTKSFFSKLFK